MLALHHGPELTHGRTRGATVVRRLGRAGVDVRVLAAERLTCVLVAEWASCACEVVCWEAPHSEATNEA
jgi:hypothetical protein